jgi:transcriptional regulator GlxA family with amidase domain
MASLAQRLNMSARNLSRVFSKECGVSLIAFLNDARIDAARRYLESTDHAVSTIARRCGFESADTLRRTFSRRLHISPMEYRQRFRSNDMSNPGTALKRTKATEKV